MHCLSCHGAGTECYRGPTNSHFLAIKVPSKITSRAAGLSISTAPHQHVERVRFYDDREARLPLFIGKTRASGLAGRDSL